MFGRTKQAIYMHQIDGFGELTTVPVVPHVERSLLMGGTVCVTEDTDLTILPWLGEEGLAPEEVCRISGGCMFKGLLADKVQLHAFKERLQSGERLQLFHSTNHIASFLDEAGLNWGNTMSCEPSIADKIGNKAYLRRMAAEIGLSSAFPSHWILTSSWNQSDLDWAIRMTQPPQTGHWHVLVKPTDLAGGEGICRVGSPEFRFFAKRFRGREVIVEKEIMHRDSLSVQWFICCGRPRYIGINQQLVEGFVPQGELLSSGDDVVPYEVSKAFREMTEPLVERAVQLNYQGVLAYDGVLDRRSNKVYLLDADTRVTSATYGYAIADRLGMKKWAIANKIIEPGRWIETFNRVRGLLGGNILFRQQRGSGVIPYMLGALHAKVRRIGLMAVAEDKETTAYYLREAEHRLTA